MSHYHNFTLRKSVIALLHNYLRFQILIGLGELGKLTVDEEASALLLATNESVLN